MSDINIEDRITDTFKSMVEKLTTIVDNDIEVLKLFDNTQERPAKYVVIDVENAERLQPNYNFYKMRVKCVCLSYIPDDKSGAMAQTMYQACFGMINSINKTNIQSELDSLHPGSGITIDGIVPQQGDRQAHENYQMITAECDIFLKYTTN